MIKVNIKGFIKGWAQGTWALCMTWSRDLVDNKIWLWHKMDTRNEKSVLKVAKWPSLRPQALKSEFLLEFDFLKN